MAQKYRLHLTVAAALCVAMIAGSGAARAEDTETQSVTVSAAGLDLASVSGQSVLQGRISRAIKQACGSDHTGSLSANQDYKKCVWIAQNEAVEQSRALIASRAGNTRVASAEVRIMFAAK